jgi:hypothetical protein
VPRVVSDATVPVVWQVPSSWVDFRWMLYEDGLLAMTLFVFLPAMTVGSCLLWLSGKNMLLLHDEWRLLARAHLREDSLGYDLTDGRRPAPPDVVKARLGPGSLLQEEMLLAPFLNMIDLLDTSEAAAWLLPYRTQLGEVIMFRWCGYRSAAALTEQRRLHTIRLGKTDRWVTCRQSELNADCVLSLDCSKVKGCNWLEGLFLRPAGAGPSSHKCVVLAARRRRWTRRTCARCWRAWSKGRARRCRSST